MPDTLLLAHDSLKTPSPARRDEAGRALAALSFAPGTFAVSVRAADPGHPPEMPDHIVRFPSPRPGALAGGNEVHLLWFAPQGLARPAPACLVMPTVNPELTHARRSARLLAQRGVHAFVPILPGTPMRGGDPRKGFGVEMLERGAQAVADARRAVDAIRHLPMVEGSTIGLHAMSLGGVLGLAVAGLDNPFRAILLAATGTDPGLVLTRGMGVAAEFRRRLAEAGYDDDRLHRLLAPLDPTPLLPRVRTAHCRVILPAQDEVFPAASQARMLQGLEAAHPFLTRRPGDHAAAHAWLPDMADMLAHDLFLLLPR